MSPFPEQWHIGEHLLLLKKGKNRELMYDFTLCILILEDSCLRDFPLRAPSLFLGLAVILRKIIFHERFHWYFSLGFWHIVNTNFGYITFQNLSIKDNDPHLLLFALLRHKWNVLTIRTKLLSDQKIQCYILHVLIMFSKVTLYWDLHELQMATVSESIIYLLPDVRFSTWYFITMSWFNILFSYCK